MGNVQPIRPNLSTPAFPPAPTARRQRRNVDTPPRVAWDKFLPSLGWRQGEHVSLIGPTGGGKSTLALALLPYRQHVIVLATKPADDTLEGLKLEGYQHSQGWPAPRVFPRRTRILVWPTPKRNRMVQESAEAWERRQRVAFDGVLRDAFTQGAWCLYMDELRYLTDLGFGRQIERYWQQGRALNISVVACAQRPAHVPLSMYSQATHLFLWRTNDETDLRRLGGIGFADSKQIRETVARLELFDVLYVNSRTGRMAVTRVSI